MDALILVAMLGGSMFARHRCHEGFKPERRTVQRLISLGGCLIPAIPALIVGLEDADKIGHARPVPVVSHIGSMSI
jgi:hypothetical protein